MLDAYVYIMVAYGKVRALNRRLSRAALAKMRVGLLSADFGLRHLLLLLGIVLLHLPDNLMAEPCPAANCLSAEKCESTWVGAVCQDSNLQCCSIVKEEYRTQCRHHGGECMNRCSPVVQRPAVDCPGQLCCVLV
ncbi:uncharacterized protein LOC107263513 [Cephus cinctus]|uniref:Uncharacterized protein LOC107263513 n=1 Tax=Cephus cinctus TaxID=211228 RepID=A0AAJ7BHN2_CEPCN|nr:uncharacterized protein LOC107263513 [Cephus cinctus]